MPPGSDPSTHSQLLTVTPGQHRGWDAWPGQQSSQIIPASMLPWGHREQLGVGVGITSWRHLGLPPCLGHQVDGLPLGNRIDSPQGMGAWGPLLRPRLGPAISASVHLPAQGTASAS